MSSKTHGLSRTSMYQVWNGMMSRCYRKNHRVYHHYGGRGIIVCERWRTSFLNFWEDMGERPSKEYTLDRIDCNGNYEPSNCRWATWDQQMNNRRNQREYKGERRSIKEWAKIYNIKPDTIYSRLKIGHSFEKALTTPHRYLKNRITS